jgi:GNAT superfamily N-acetyltransferase
MVNFVQFDPIKHEEKYIKLNIELLNWYKDQLLEHYNVDTVLELGQTVEEYVAENTDFLTSLKPPEGIIYILEVDEEVAGTGAVKRFRDSQGELKRMYIRPKFRGKGYGKLLINKLLQTGNEYGWISFILDTPRFAYAAHGLYRSVGFVERGPYPESEAPKIWTKYWMYMEKK